MLRAAAALRFAFATTAVCLAAGCAAPTAPLHAPVPPLASNPLGPSYVLVPLPTEDDGLLGRIVPRPPGPGRSIEETARANPCLAELEASRLTPLASSFDDAEELGVDAKARAMLGAYGFGADVSRATHFSYRLETSRRLGKGEGGGYAACCKTKGCGYGYVSALVYGEGEYATGEELSGRAEVGAFVASGSSGVKLRVLHARRVRGWIAALITVTDAAGGDVLGPLGAASVGVTEETVSETVKQIYDRNKIRVEREDDSFVFTDGVGRKVKEIAFARSYLAVTGSHELDALDRRRNPTAVAAAGALTAASLGVALFGLASLDRPCTGAEGRTNLDCYDFMGNRAPIAGARTENDWAPPVALLGGLGVAGFGTLLVIAGLRRDGSPTDHLLTERDAIVYADRHNRALLRAAAKRMMPSERTSRVQITPVFSPTGIGLSGRF